MREKELSSKLKLVYFISINNHAKIENETFSDLLNSYSEIKTILNLKDYTKILFINRRKVHVILYNNDIIIELDDSKENDLKTNYYLDLLIKDEIDLINYKFSFNYIKKFNQLKQNDNNKYYNIIKTKIIIDLLNNYENSELEEGDKGGGFLSEFENEKMDYIKKNIMIIKEINPYLSEEIIYDMNIDQLYTHIITFLIKRNKFHDYDFCYDIIKQLELEYIEIYFLESESLFKQILEVLDTKNDFIKIYVIRNFEDIKDNKKINFYFILLNYILKSPIYIYQIPLLFQLHNKIIEFIKTEDFSSITFDSNNMKERFEFILKKLSDLDYYYSLYLKKKKQLTNIINKNKVCSNYIVKKDTDNKIFLNDNGTMTIKKENPENNIIEELLKQSNLSFDISMNAKKMAIIANKIINYGNSLKIKYDELLELNKNNNIENNSELIKTFSLFCKFLEDLFHKIEENINNQIIISDIQIQLLFQSSAKNVNLDVIYSIPEERTSFQDEDILDKKIDELKGLNLFISEIRSYFRNNQQETGSNTNNLNSILTNTSSNISKNQDLKNYNDDSYDYQITKFKNNINKHPESIKFFFPVKNKYYFCCGSDKSIILYNKDFDQLQTIPNMDSILYHLSEKESENDKIIELIACCLINIYLIKINLSNGCEYKIRKYEIPKTKILFCKPMMNTYIILGINIVIKVNDDIFNDNIAQKRMFRLSGDSYKTGCLINNNYIALISNSLIPGGKNQLAIFNLTSNKLIYNISNYSPAITENGMKLIKLRDNNILLSACKKYDSFGKNGILIVDVSCLKYEDMDNIKYKFFETPNFEVYCFCQIYLKKINLNDEIMHERSNYFFIGGFDLDKKKGAVKLFEAKRDDILKIKYLQDLENFDEFEMPVNNIIQNKNSGEIIITTTDGGIFIFSEPNINLYLNK